MPCVVAVLHRGIGCIASCNAVQGYASANKVHALAPPKGPRKSESDDVWTGVHAGAHLGPRGGHALACFSGCLISEGMSAL